MVYILRKKYECSLVGNKNITSIAGTSNMTHSGRIFSPPPSPPKETNSDALAKARGKELIDSQPEPSVGQEAGKLLRILNRSDYKVVDQLNQTPSKISILSLLLCS